MKERRTSGATHSFRLSIAAATIVDEINYPRSLGGKSKKVSDAIIWFFSAPVESKGVGQMPFAGTMPIATPEHLLDRCITLQERVEFFVRRAESFEAEVERLKKGEKEPSTPHWWHRFWPF
jgi:hypothetical protein